MSHKVTYAAACLDQSVPNFSSLVVLFEHDGRRVLFTGDARGDQIATQLAEVDLLADGTVEVNALKVPHPVPSGAARRSYLRQSVPITT